MRPTLADPPWHPLNPRLPGRRLRRRHPGESPWRRRSPRPAERGRPAAVSGTNISNATAIEIGTTAQ
ncbi:hypothetical protein, partial [Streptosporangium sp. NPDC048865]|uniref:hypothetical protein n=1 Tax=Streptosporangium sp. NPDC048865 TaxID=3155766 RepID=UPI00344A87AA